MSHTYICCTLHVLQHLPSQKYDFFVGIIIVIVRSDFRPLPHDEMTANHTRANPTVTIQVWFFVSVRSLSRQCIYCIYTRKVAKVCSDLCCHGVHLKVRGTCSSCREGNLMRKKNAMVCRCSAVWRCALASDFRWAGQDREFGEAFDLSILYSTCVRTPAGPLPPCKCK